MGTAGEGSCEPQQARRDCAPRSRFGSGLSPNLPGTSPSQAKELLAALATRALPHTCLPRFSSRQLVTLVWAHARRASRRDAAEMAPRCRRDGTEIGGAAAAHPRSPPPCLRPTPPCTPSPSPRRRLGVQPPQETLDAWRQAMRAAVDQRPLQKADRQSLEASLGKLGETCRGAWIPDTSEPAESEADAVSAA